MGEPDIERVENRLQRVEHRQDRQETMLTDTVERVRDLSISLARQDERFVSIDRTVTAIHESQKRREELERQYREQDSQIKVDALQKAKEVEAKFHQQRILWAAGAILMLALLLINIAVAA